MEYIFICPEWMLHAENKFKNFTIYIYILL